MEVHSWDDYQRLSSVTAIYPGRDRFLGLMYVVSGLADEAFELYEASHGEYKSECSDCMWYIAQTAHELGLGLQEVADEAVELEVQMRTFSMDEAVHQVLGPACKMNGILKKIIRDDNTVLSEEKRGKMKFQLACMLCGLLNVCKFIGVTWQEVTSYNLEKLYSRMERGKLGGSGDHR